MKNEIIIGITKKLSDQLKIKKLSNIDIYSPNLHTWHAGFKFINRKKCILFTNDLTLYSFLLYGVKKEEIINLNQIFKEKLIENLSADNFTPEEISFLVSPKSNISIIKTNNRSVLGSMNDFFHLLPFYIGENENVDQINLISVNKKLNKTPMQCSKKGFYPIEKLHEIVNIQTSRT